MSLYLVTYAINKPKTGHRPELSTRVVQAACSADAMALFLRQSSHGSLYSLQADWVGTEIIKPA